MGKLVVATLLLLINLTSLLPSLACPTCPTPTTPPPPKKKPPPPPKVLPPPPPSPPPPSPPPPKPTPCPPPPSPPIPKPSPPPPPPPTTPKPVPCPPPPKSPPSKCPIDTLKLDACVDLLGGLVHIGIGANAKDKCCPVLEGLADLDAALCLCTTIKAKLLNINVLLPIALELLVDCGKHPPSDYQCPA